MNAKRVEGGIFSTSDYLRVKIFLSSLPAHIQMKVANARMESKL